MSESFDLVEQFPVITRRKVFACPNCNCDLVMPVQIQLMEPQRAQTEAEATSPMASLSPDQRALVEACEKAGVLAEFERAFRRSQPQGTRNIYRTFLSWAKTAVPKRVPTWVIDHYSSEFNAYLTFHGSQGVVSVSAAGVLRAFVPMKLILGEGIRGANGGGVSMMRLSAPENDFRDWVRTRNGYVPADCKLFIDEMRKRSVGEFAEVRL